MQCAIGYVLQHVELGHVRVIEVHLIPTKGYVVFPGHNRNLRFIWDEELGWPGKQLYGARPGQGKFRARYIDLANSDPRLAHESLEGCFLYNGDDAFSSAEVRCRLELSSRSVIPFMFSPEREASQPESLESFRNDRLEDDVWYPVELLPEAADPGQAAGDGPSPDWGYGVFLVRRFEEERAGPGILKLVYPNSWGPGFQAVRMYRHGREVGRASWPTPPHPHGITESPA